MAMGYQRQVNGTLILVFGILSLVICALLGPVAWIMGNDALGAIDRGEADPTQRTTVNAGRICGIIGTVLLALGILYVVVMFVFFAGFAGSMRATPAPS